MTTADLTAAFGWMTLINFAIYTLSAAIVVLWRDRMVRLQSRLTNVPKDAWPGIYVDYLGRYKLLILVFNLSPYLALRIIA